MVAWDCGNVLLSELGTGYLAKTFCENQLTEHKRSLYVYCTSIKSLH